MSPEAQRIAIAEAAGWKWFLSPFNNEQKVLTRSQEDANNIKLGVWIWELTPDYLNDLNAMHEAEKTLTLEQHEAWAGHMAEICTKPTLTEALFVGYWSRGFKIMSSTPTQRAEAFLRTIGKWQPAP